MDIDVFAKLPTQMGFQIIGFIFYVHWKKYFVMVLDEE